MIRWPWILEPVFSECSNIFKWTLECIFKIVGIGQGISAEKHEASRGYVLFLVERDMLDCSWYDPRKAKILILCKDTSTSVVFCFLKKKNKII